MNTKKLLAGAALVTLSAGLAPSQAMAVKGTGNISAIVVQPITISAVNTMKFGSFSVTTTGKIPLDTAGVVAGRTGSTPIGGTIQSGSFKISGDPRLMDVSVDTSATIKNTDTVAGGVMSVTGINFACNTANFTVKVTGVATGQCDLNATKTTGKITTGGTLNYTSGQTAGTYTGTYNIFVSYN